MRFPPSGIHCPTCKTLILPTPESGVISTRRQQKTATYARWGKKCGDCHAYHDVSTGYNACSANSDGLQYSCKGCIALRYNLGKLDNGRLLWKTTRDQLRAQNDAANQAAGRP